MMNKVISPVSTGLLIILTGLISVPARSQIPGASPTPSSSPTPGSFPTSSPSPTPSSSPTSSPSQIPSSFPTPSPSPGATEPVGGNVITKFECSTRTSSSGEVLLRANGYYTQPDGTGKYQAIPQGYRFLTGSLREQSIVRAKKGFVLVATKDEAKNTSLTSVEGAPMCTGGIIYR